MTFLFILLEALIGVFAFGAWKRIFTGGRPLEFLSRGLINKVLPNVPALYKDRVIAQRILALLRTLVHTPAFEVLLSHAVAHSRNRLARVMRGRHS